MPKLTVKRTADEALYDPRRATHPRVDESFAGSSVPSEKEVSQYASSVMQTTTHPLDLERRPTSLQQRILTHEQTSSPFPDGLGFLEEIYQQIQTENNKAPECMFQQPRLSHPTRPHLPNIQRNINNKELMQAINDRDIYLLQRLIDIGADPNHQDDDGCTPLHIALNNNFSNVVDVLLDNGAIVDGKKNKTGDTVLHIAICKCPRLFQKLLDAAVDGKDELLQIKNGAGLTPSDIQNNIQNTIQNNKKLMRAIKDRDIYQLKRLLDEGADPNHQDEDGCTPLHLALNINSPTIVDILLNKGAVVDGKRNKTGETVLHTAVCKCPRILQKLLDAAGDRKDELLQIKNDGGSTPDDIQPFFEYRRNIDNKELMQAVNDRDIYLLQRLIDIGADPNHQDDDGCTPLHIALNNNSPNVVDTLLNRDAVVDGKQTKTGDTILHIAKYKCPQLFQKLLDAADKRKDELLQIKNGAGLTPGEILE